MSYLLLTMLLHVVIVFFSVAYVSVSTDDFNNQALIDKLQVLEATVHNLQSSLKLAMDHAKQQDIINRALEEKLEVLNMKCDTAFETIALNKNSTRFNATSEFLPFMSKRILQPPSSSIKEVGFTAIRHSTGVVVNEGGTIVFETPITNIGSAYNPSTGIFTAPFDGLYVFFFDIECSIGYGDGFTELIRNGAGLNIQTNCHGTGDIDNSATMGVLRLHVGDTVWIRLYYGNNKRFGGKTLFSGFMV